MVDTIVDYNALESPAPAPGHRRGDPVARLVLITIACGLALAPVQQRPTFRSNSLTVYIYATVQGKDGRLVTDLTRDDFQILDDGRPRPLAVFDNTPQDITLAAMFDMSNSMAKHHGRIQEAAGALVRALWPADRARIGSFGIEAAISPFITSDKAVLLRVVNEELRPGGPTPLWHATELAMTALAGEPGRRVILLFTDGDDSGFLAPGSRGKVRTLAEAGSFMIYAVGLQGNGMADDMRALVDATGGGRFLVGRDDDLGATFARVVEELHHQYVLGFSTDVLDGRSHNLTVKTTRPGTNVRARQKYLARRP